MIKYAFLCGCAKNGFQQKKISLMHEFLVSSGKFRECEIVLFPNGNCELLLEYALNNAIEQKCEKFFLYICASSSISSENIIRKSIVEKYAEIAQQADISFKVVYECDDEFLREEALGWEKVI